MNNKKQLKQKDTKVETTERKPVPRSAFYPYLSQRMELPLLALLAAVLYVNSLWGGFVLDDVMSVTNNDFVQKGITGIGKILSTDSLFGYVGYTNDLQGGRYRPFPLILFAIEHQIWGNNPFYYHLMNIVFWVSTVCVLYVFLKKYLFKNKPEIALISTLIFIIHPIHTEVVANIKSIDEIYSLFFLLSGSLLLFSYVSKPKNNIPTYMLSVFLYFIALFSKENGITFLVILPLMMYFFTDLPLKKIILLTIPFIVVFAGYFAIRLSVIGLNNYQSNLLQNNPFLYATFDTRYGTVMVCLLKYLGLLFFPHPLSYDYTFNQIPLAGILSPWSILSICVYSALLVYSIVTIKSKNIVSFIVLFYLLSIFITSNILVDIGALLGERFLFQSSVAFSLFAGIAIYWLIHKLHAIKVSKTLSFGLIVLPIVLLASGKTIARNNAWKSEYNLYSTDVKSCPNSAVANNNAGVVLILYTDTVKDKARKSAMLSQAVSFCRKSRTIMPDFYDGYVNAAIALIRDGKPDEALTDVFEIKKRNPKFYKLPNVISYLTNEYNARARAAAEAKHLDKAVRDFDIALQLDSTNIATYNNLGIALCLSNDFKTAIAVYKDGLKRAPTDQSLLSNIAVTYLKIGDNVHYMKYAMQFDSIKRATGEVRK